MEDSSERCLSMDRIPQPDFRHDKFLPGDWTLLGEDLVQDTEPHVIVAVTNRAFVQLQACADDNPTTRSAFCLGVGKIAVTKKMRLAHLVVSDAAMDPDNAKAKFDLGRLSAVLDLYEATIMFHPHVPIKWREIRASLGSTKKVWAHLMTQLDLPASDRDKASLALFEWLSDLPSQDFIDGIEAP